MIGTRLPKCASGELGIGEPKRITSGLLSLSLRKFWDIHFLICERQAVSFAGLLGHEVVIEMCKSVLSV